MHKGVPDMFNLNTLEKYQTELFFSLLRQYEELQNSENIHSKESKTFEKYLSIRSLAGMETWISAYRERIFFYEIYKNLESINSESEISSFKQEILHSLKVNFREEDFRFHSLENAQANKKAIMNNLKKIIKSLNSLLRKLNPFFLPNKKSISFETDGRPSEIGLDVKLLKTETSADMEGQIFEAEKELKQTWEFGYKLYKLLTKKIIIISSPGLVSFSYFNEPGISYINIRDRDLFDTIDDLVHENSHHHLNLLLKKYKLIKNNNYYFYSPWRQELRSSYAILHSVFTFSYGALLFENFINKPTPFLKSHRNRALVRLMEETIMIKYSMEDLFLISDCFYSKGLHILEYLNQQNQRILGSFSEYFSLLKSNTYKKRLSEIEKSLIIARKTYNFSRAYPQNAGKS